MRIEPYLSFGGRCEEALGFYARCLGGTIVALNRYAGSPLDTPKLPAGWKDKVLHAELEAEGTRILASDGLPGAARPVFSGITLSLDLGEDKQRAERIFDALAEGGQVRMPLAPKFWGAAMGMLQDRYGVGWMVSCAP
jgi:PhnB protein